MFRYVLKKISALLVIILINTPLLGMRCDYKGKPLVLPFRSYKMNFEKLAPELKCNVIDLCEDPIALGQTNTANHALVKKLGMRNLRRYHNKENDPRFLLSHYVPVLVSSFCGVAINPYYRAKIDLHKEILSFELPIIPELLLFELNEDSLDKLLQASKLLETLQNKSLQADKLLEKLQVVKKIRKKRVWEFTLFGKPSSYEVNDPLVVTSLFGTQDDIKNILATATTPVDFAVYRTGENDSHLALQFLIEHHYTENSNNAFTILLSSVLSKVEILGDDEDFFFDFNVRTMQDKKAYLYSQLLFVADRAKNKKVFEYLIHTDPFDSINFLAQTSHISNGKVTILDRMIIGEFSPENIELCKKAGGKTAQQIKYSNSSCVIS